ncbi:uncharacterized protein LOC130670705 [Microplitis mediator]|uniref:uncharacterized protein LOC130670705 n=1 Tax=Microplitis mediator TaxID=375433 RepID=UPI0025540F2C|nr:uncharacterized protein LOC130670705 [Microplitis mediator]
MLLIGSFFRRIFKDLRQKELLPLKLIFFVQASTLYVLYPYLTIHMRELGINVEETAIMSAVTPFIAIVMPPVAGVVADRIGNFKIMLSFFSSLGGAAALLLLLVPVGRVTVKYPEQIVMDLGCSRNDSNIIITINQMNHHCDNRVNLDIIAGVQSCGYICHVDLHNHTHLDYILTSKSYSVEFLYDNYFNESKKQRVKYNRPYADYNQTTMTRDEVLEHRVFRNNEYYNSCIRQLSRSTVFFPTDNHLEFTCLTSNHLETESNSTTNKTVCNFKQSPTEITPDPNDRGFTAKVRALVDSDLDVLEKRKRFIVEKLRTEENANWNLGKCESLNRPYRVSAQVSVDDVEDPNFDNNLNFKGCSERCIITAPRNDICTNKDTVIEYNIQLTFWLYLAIRVFISIIGGTAFAMFEGAVIAILREQNADYGLQRIYGSIGGMISSPLSGMLIDYASTGKEYTDFRPAFYLYAGLKVVSGGLMLAINLEFKSPAHNVLSDVISVLKNVEIVALLLACFMLGTAWGYVESFLFWFLQDLGGSRSLMGITITVGGIAGIPLLVLSGPIIKRIGHANVLFIGFVFHAIRLLGYSLIYNPWHSLIFEALESVTTSLSFTAVVTYAAKLSTTTTDSSIQGLLGGLYYGVGKGAGSLMGGFIMKAVGTRPTYQIFSVVSLVSGLIYFFFNMCYLQKRPQVEGNDIVKKEPKKSVENGVNLGEKNNKNELNIKYNKSKKGNENGGLKKNIEINLKAIEAAANGSKAAEAEAQDVDVIKRMPEENPKIKKNKNKKLKNSNEMNLNKIDTRDGATNPGFLDDRNDESQCNVTVEKVPEDNK